MVRYIFKWSGEHISLNDWYASQHWTVRNTQKRKWMQIFSELINEQKPKPIKKYALEMRYNSRLDPTNTITMVKLFEDTLRDKGIIIDDTKKYCSYISIKPELTLGKKHYEIELIEIDE